MLNLIPRPTSILPSIGSFTISHSTKIFIETKDDEIVAIGIQVLPVTEQDVLRAGDMSRQHGLLSGDALIVAVMQASHLTSLASNDADFDQVPGLTRYAPI